MKKLLILFLIGAIGAISCATEKRCGIKYPCVTGKDSVYIETVDTVKIPIPGDTIKIETKIPCEDFTLITEDGKVLQELNVTDGTLKQKIIIKTDTVYSFKTNTITETKYIPKPVEVKYVPKFTLITSRIGIVIILLITGYFGIKYGKKLLI